MIYGTDALEGARRRGAPCKPQVAEIYRKQTQYGGWTRAQVQERGVPWPPPSGWKEPVIQKLMKVEPKH